MRPGQPAVFSADRVHRYTLWRDMSGRLFDGEGGYVMFIGVNPSTADEQKDDPTLRKVQTLTRMWGYSEVVMTNLFAFRATDPDVMKASASPIGEDNDYWLDLCARFASMIVCAWGKHGAHRQRDKAVLRRLLNGHGEKIYHLGRNFDGTPKHPCYLPNSTKHILWK